MDPWGRVGHLNISIQASASQGRHRGMDGAIPSLDLYRSPCLAPAQPRPQPASQDYSIRPLQEALLLVKLPCPRPKSAQFLLLHSCRGKEAPAPLKEFNAQVVEVVTACFLVVRANGKVKTIESFKGCSMT